LKQFQETFSNNSMMTGLALAWLLNFVCRASPTGVTLLRNRTFHP